MTALARAGVSSSKASSPVGGRISLYLTLAVVALAPLPLGSADTVWIIVWSLPLAVALLVMPVPPLRSSQKIILSVVVGLGGLYAALATFQLVGGGDFSNDLWKQAAAALRTDLDAPAGTLDASQSLLALGHPLLMLMTFVAVLLLSASRENAALVLKTVAYSGALYAVYGFLALLFSPNTLLWTTKTAYVNNLTGTFINRNTAATYFGFCSVIWLVLLMTKIRQVIPDEKMTFSDAVILLSNPTPFAVIFSAFGFIICIISVFMTSSRAGVVATLLSVGLVAAIYSTRRLSNVVSRRWLIVTSFGLALLVAQLFGGQVERRLDAVDLDDDGRWSVYATTFRMIADHPLMGTGVGTFEQAFPPYRGAEFSYRGFWDMAHSTPLEIAVEMGAPMAGAVVVVWIGGLFLLLRGAVVRRRDMAFSLAGFGVGLLGSLHTSVDFSLQIPGCSIPFVAIVACGLAQSARTST